MKTYILYVYCSTGGVSRDAGRHSSIETDDESQALRKLRQDADWLLSFYDTVACNIECEDGQECKSVTSYTLYQTHYERTDIMGNKNSKPNYRKGAVVADILVVIFFSALALFINFVCLHPWSHNPVNINQVTNNTYEFVCEDYRTDDVEFKNSLQNFLRTQPELEVSSIAQGQGDRTTHRWIVVFKRAEAR